ncbi:MAG: hypothetical protein CVU41_18080 [Chloroflexi bacterium HGW-Chloroflexi-3]|nr:MAG: hypothetical protein CVU41_18080 [Chloroflexi bacterium HGW-Chloroflexi-3]
MNTRFYRNVLLKALLLFVIFNLLLVFLPRVTGKDQLSLYNNLVPGRQRFPFGEAPQQAYNFSLYDLDAMFSSHEVSARTGSKDEFRVFLLGDSSVWGTLLKPEETLAGQLNAAGLSCQGVPVKFYNHGYPTISLTKDLMVLERAMRYDPDLIIWLTTLEAFPLEKQLASPLALNNPGRIQPLVEQYNLPLEVTPPAEDFWSRTLWGQRRDLADWLRLQVYGVMWAATGFDQFYTDYEPAAWDLAADENYFEFSPPDLPNEQLLWQALPAALDIAGGTPLLLVNEPIMISAGENSDVHYNFFYPRWAYDQYREELIQRAQHLAIPTIDAWDWIDPHEFTNSAIHLTPVGEEALAQDLKDEILDGLCP